MVLQLQFNDSWPGGGEDISYAFRCATIDMYLQFVCPCPKQLAILAGVTFTYICCALLSRDIVLISIIVKPLSYQSESRGPT